MIPFFRKIRKKMADDKRPLKYMRYAIGEVILVVIGILIALSINNWNQNQIERKTTNNYLKKIESNIQQDLKVSQSLLEFRTNNSSQCVKASQMLINRDFSAQSTIQNAIFGLILEITLNYNRTAFESLKNSGNLSKIEDPSIESLIYNYYSLVDEIVNQEIDLQKWSNELELELDKNGFMYKWLELDTKVHPDLTKQVSNYDEKLCEHNGHAIIMNLLLRGTSNTTFLTPAYKKQIKAGKELSQTIIDYIKNE